MFATSELFGKFHTSGKSVRAMTATLGQKNLHQMETVCDAWIAPTRLANVAGGHGRRRVYTPKLTFLTFLSQTMTPGASCRAAVRQVQAHYQCQPVPLRVSPDNSPYCQARARLEPDQLITIRAELAQRMEQALPTGDWTWGRPVKVVDGTCLTLPDTVENQAAYPQSSSQGPGCGFPQLRLLGLFSLDTGALLERARGQSATSEVQLFRKLWPHLVPGDLILGDRIFGFYTALAHLSKLGVDGIFRLNAQRDQDFRRGRRLGHHDRFMTWCKPRQMPAGMTAEQWALVPAQIVVREVKIKINDPRCRVKEVVLVTTLLDPKQWSRKRLAELLRRRWQVELNFDDLKTTLQMDRLSCLKPSMIHRELEMHLIGYNLTRALMLEAAISCQAPLYRLSFKGTLDTVREFRVSMVRIPAAQKQKRRAIYREMLATIAKDLVPDRPGRREPRCQKARPKAYPFMTKPRCKMKDAPKSSRRKRKIHKKP
jgi:transposase